MGFFKNYRQRRVAPVVEILAPAKKPLADCERVAVRRRD
jgi:hypothetical protein